MFAKLPKFQVDFASFLLRWGLAAIFIVHGAVKIDQSVPMIREMSQLEWAVVGWAELLGGLALVLGLFSRPAALGIAALQIGAIIRFTGHYALYVAPFSIKEADYRKVGPEYNLVLIAMCLSVLVLGSGVFSLDHLLVTLWRRRKAPTPPGAVPLPNEARVAPALRADAAHAENAKTPHENLVSEKAHP